MPLVLPAIKLVGLTTGEVPSEQLVPPMAQRMVYVAGGVPTVTGAVQVVDQAVPPVLNVPAVTLCGAEGLIGVVIVVTGVEQAVPLGLVAIT